MSCKSKMCFALMIFLLVSSAGSVTAQATSGENYIYDYWGDTQKSIPAFELVATVNEENFGVRISGIDDVAAGGGRIFFVDSQESRVNVLDEEYEMATSIKLLRNEEGKIVVDEKTGEQVMLNGPEGVWFHENTNEIYIADTGAERIVILDGDSYALKSIIERPDNMLGVTQFRPSKIAVDSQNKIYCVVQSGYEGIIQLDMNGDFITYFGVNSPVVNLFDYFWKSIASDEQREKMAKTYAPAFNNIDIDADGFVYATCSDSAAEEMVFRLNPKGENVLRQEGYVPVAGDIEKGSGQSQSQFVDVAINEYGVYAVLDQIKGRIFLYDFDGALLNIFGGISNVQGDFKAPSSIAWFGDKLVATDKTLRCLYVYNMTDFGSAALGAAESYYNGQWEDAAEYSLEALRLNANYDLAYVVLGKHYLMNNDYENAMYYLKLGNDKKYYSMAFNGYRNNWVKDHFVIIIIAIFVVAFFLVGSEIRYHRRRRVK